MNCVTLKYELNTTVSHSVLRLNHLMSHDTFVSLFYLILRTHLDRFFDVVQRLRLTPPGTSGEQM